MSRDTKVRLMESIGAVAVAILAVSVFGGERVPICDSNGEAIPGSVVEVRMLVDGQQYASWTSGMCPQEYEHVADRLDVLMAGGGPF